MAQGPTACAHYWSQHLISLCFEAKLRAVNDSNAGWRVSSGPGRQQSLTLKLTLTCHCFEGGILLESRLKSEGRVCMSLRVEVSSGPVVVCRMLTSAC